VQRDSIIQSFYSMVFLPGLENSFNQVVGVINDPMCLCAHGAHVCRMRSPGTWGTVLLLRSKSQHRILYWNVLRPVRALPAPLPCR
jgi:hypothetical protein